MIIEMKRSPLTGVTEGVFDSLLVRVPPNTGQLVEVATLVAGSAYDDTELAASVAVNSASTAVNSANIASHTSTLAQHASDISGNANASDLLTPVPVGAVFSDTPLDVWHSGSSQYIPTGLLRELLYDARRWSGIAHFRRLVCEG